MKRTAVGIIAAALVFGCTSSKGGAPLAPAPGDAAALRPAAEAWAVELVDAFGRALPTYRQGDAAWVEGRYGERYAVRVQNRSDRRIEAVITVDGRDVVSGAPGDFRSQRGYVVEPHDSVTIEGFRQSHDNVATFRFTDPGDSYAGRLGAGSNIGVIGVAVFTDAAPVALAPPPAPPHVGWGGTDGERDEVAPRKSAPAAEAQGAPSVADRGAARPGNLGTRYGETRHAPSVEVEFRRSSEQPKAVLGVYYDDREGLVARGILAAPPPPPPGPQPFPATTQQFAPPP
ncbi:MAG: hypothetical protein H6704_02740 [Myxococcales bacterium]|nr:hypothetical protein [Myxococcales bacterium]